MFVTPFHFPFNKGVKFPNKAKKILGWKPKFTFENGIKIVLQNKNYWKSSPIWTKKKIKVATKNWFKYLSKFSSNDILLSSLATGSIGDAFADLNQFQDAYDYYVKASKADNNYTTPLFLYKA